MLAGTQLLATLPIGPGGALNPGEAVAPIRFLLPLWPFETHPNTQRWLSWANPGATIRTPGQHLGCGKCDLPPATFFPRFLFFPR